jgi:hypothetical protein
VGGKPPLRRIASLRSSWHRVAGGAVLWLLASGCTAQNPAYHGPPRDTGSVVDDAGAGRVDVMGPPTADAAAPEDGPDEAMSPDDAAPADGPAAILLDAASPSDLARDAAAPDAAPPDLPLDVTPPACPGTADEDEDGVPDVCDNCPADYNPDQANVMETNAGVAADALGDACDPRPTQSGDSLLFFDGFASSTLDPAWTAERSAFSVSGGALVFERPGDTTARSLQRGMGTDVLVNTTFAFLAWGSDSDPSINQNLFVGVRGSTSGDDVRCSARRSSSSGNATSVAYFSYGNSAAPATTIPAPLALGTTYRLTTMVRGSEVECGLGAARINMTGAPVLDGVIQIRVRNVALRIQNIVAYRLRSP